MLIKLLSEADRPHLIDLARLLALCDKPLLWDGKTPEHFTADTNLQALTIKEGELEQALIADMESNVPRHSEFLGRFPFGAMLEVRERLVDELKAFPIPQALKPETRVQAARTVLRELLKTKSFDSPSACKVVLFELMLVALRDGNISGIEWSLLKEYQAHHQLEDFIFNDLLARAEVLTVEIGKTISLILE